MPSRLIQNKVLRYSIAVALIASAYGCSSSEGGGGGNGLPFPTGNGGSSGGSRTGGSSGSNSGGSTGSGSGGSTSGGSTGGTSGSGTGGTTSGGTGGSSGGGTGGTTTTPGTGGTTSGGTGGSSGDAGMPPADTGNPGMMPMLGNPITGVVPSAGCGKAPGPTGRQMIQTMGTKPADAADTKKGPWSYNREYFVDMPANYDMNKPYNLIFQGPGCNGNATQIYSYNNNVDNTAIMVGLTPPPLDIGHSEVGTSARCFDDKDKYSVDVDFYEKLYDRLNEQFCFDRNRVFIGGNSSGGWLSNELGCKYAGDSMRPIRGLMPNTGGLPQDPRLFPPCSDKPTSGFWVHERNDATNPFTGNKRAINRAMMVNKCMGSDYDTAMFDNFPIGGGNPDNTCRKIRGCPELHPLIVCELPGNGHGSHDNVVNPGVNTYIKMFSAGAFLTR